MNNLTLFSFQNQEIRFVDGKPVAKDVALCLKYSDPSKAIRTHVSPHNKGVAKTPSPLL